MIKTLYSELLIHGQKLFTISKKQTMSTGRDTNLTPASPTMPIAMPAERPAKPQDKPDERCA
jgi:hypothetical protein